MKESVEIKISDLLIMEKIITSCAFTHRKKFKRADGTTSFATTAEVIKPVKDEQLPSAEEIFAVTKLIDSYVEASNQ